MPLVPPHSFGYPFELSVLPVADLITKFQSPFFYNKKSCPQPHSCLHARPDKLTVDSLKGHSPLLEMNCPTLLRSPDYLPQFPHRAKQTERPLRLAMVAFW
ncbi:hypothetical protein NMG60_11013708 [Bertholletia excelsa]